MTGFPWLPMGTPLEGGTVSGRSLDSGPAWQLCEAGNGTVLLLRPGEGPAWLTSELAALDEAAGPLGRMEDLVYLPMPPGQRPRTLAGLALRQPPVGRVEAQAVTRALLAMTGRQRLAGWSTALFLPGPSIALAMAEAPDEDRRAVLVAVLSGGIGDGTLPVSRIAAANPLLDAGNGRRDHGLGAVRPCRPVRSPRREGFKLPGQPGLQAGAPRAGAGCATPPGRLRPPRRVSTGRRAPGGTARLRQELHRCQARRFPGMAAARGLGWRPSAAPGFTKRRAC